jgi:hypothetical protein
MENINSIIESPSFWAIAGVVIGYALNEISRVIRDAFKRKNIKNVIVEELISIKYQIDQKIDILNQAISALKNGDYLATESVPIITIGYETNINNIYSELNVRERNCLHVIYSRLKIAEDIMRKFEVDFLTNVTNKTIKNPFAMSIDRMEELIESYNVVKELIDSYQNDKPIDVFNIEQT